MTLFWFLITTLQNITVALDIRFGGQPGQCRPNNEEIFSLSELESNPFTYISSTGTVRLPGKATFLGFIYFHVIPCEFIEAHEQWEKFVLQYHSEKKVLAALKCIYSAHSTDSNLSRNYYIF
jgi:hypothetical protein